MTHEWERKSFTQDTIPALTAKAAEWPMTLRSNEGCPQTAGDTLPRVHREYN